MIFVFQNVAQIPSTRSIHSNYGDGECGGFNTLNTIHRTFSPYLYPFIIEYCILIVGIWYMMWANISHCPRKIAAAHEHKHDSDTAIDMNSNVESASSGGFDCMENNSGKHLSIDKQHQHQIDYTLFEDYKRKRERELFKNEMLIMRL